MKQNITSELTPYNPLGNESNKTYGAEYEKYRLTLADEKLYVKQMQRTLEQRIMERAIDLHVKTQNQSSDQEKKI